MAEHLVLSLEPRGDGCDFVVAHGLQQRAAGRGRFKIEELGRGAVRKTDAAVGIDHDQALDHAVE